MCCRAEYRNQKEWLITNNCCVRLHLFIHTSYVMWGFTVYYVCNVGFLPLVHTVYTVFSSLVISVSFSVTFPLLSSCCWLPSLSSFSALSFDPPPTLHSSVRATGEGAGTANQFCSLLQQPVGVRGQRPSDSAHCCPLVISVIYSRKLSSVWMCRGCENWSPVKAQPGERNNLGKPD